MVENIVLIYFDARAITGIISANDPAGESFTSRGVRYIDPKELNCFAAIRQSTHNSLLRLGTRFLSGYAVAAEKAEKAAEILNKKASQWEAEKVNLIMKYETLVDQWVSKHPEILPFREKFPSLSWINARISFRWTSIEVSPTKDGEKGLAEMIGELPAQILVSKSWTPSSKVNIRTMRIVERVTEKLASLAFLGGKLGPMATQLRAILAALPKEGRFGPQETALVSMVLAMLSSPRTAADILSVQVQPPSPLTSFSFEKENPEPQPQSQPQPQEVEEEEDEEFCLVF